MKEPAWPCLSGGWRVVIVLAFATSIVGCVHTPPKHNTDGIDKARLATVIGSRASDGLHTFEYFLVDQIDYKDVRTRFDFALSAIDEIAIPVEQGRRVLWIEGRAKHGMGSEPKRFAGALVVDLVAGHRYQVRGRTTAALGELGIVDMESGAIVATITNIVATKPPPGYPVAAIPVFIRR